MTIGQVDGRDGSAPAPARRRALLSLELPGPDFDDPRHEWRRLFSELLGTFFLVLVGAGGAVVNASSHGQVSRAPALARPGLRGLACTPFMGAAPVPASTRAG